MVYYEKYKTSAIEAAKELKKCLEGMKRHAYEEDHNDKFPNQLNIQLGRWLQKK